MIDMTPAPPPTPMTPMTCCLLTRTTAAGTREVLLGVKKTGFGVGKLVGPGGKIEAGESAAEATAREVEEETSIEVAPEDLREAAILTFRFPARPEWDLRMWVFTGERFAGEAVESEEIACRWIPVEDVPWAEMWEDARVWLLRVLAGEYVAAEFTFADDCEHVASVREE